MHHIVISAAIDVLVFGRGLIAIIQASIAAMMSHLRNDAVGGTKAEDMPMMYAVTSMTATNFVIIRTHPRTHCV
jgi:hypothetical protein